MKFKDKINSQKQRRHDNSSTVDHREWPLHDSRYIGATMMQELSIDINILDRCQNHVLAGSKVRKLHLKYEYKDAKLQARANLGKKLEGFLFRQA